VNAYGWTLKHRFPRSSGWIGVVACLLAALAGATPALGAEASACPDNGARVFLTAKGIVSLNGKIIEVAKLKAALGSLTPRPPVICYSRQSDRREPHSSMVEVLDAIISTGIPIGFFTDGTFEERVALP
jgi:hypothetical protein